MAVVTQGLLRDALIAVWSPPLPTFWISLIYINIHVFGYLGKSFSPVEFSKPTSDEWIEIGLILLIELLVMFVLLTIVSVLAMFAKPLFEGLSGDASSWDTIKAIWKVLTMFSPGVMLWEILKNMV